MVLLVRPSPWQPASPLRHCRGRLEESTRKRICECIHTYIFIDLPSSPAVSLLLSLYSSRLLPLRFFFFLAQVLSSSSFASFVSPSCSSHPGAHAGTRFDRCTLIWKPLSRLPSRTPFQCSLFSVLTIEERSLRRHV